MYVTTMAMYVCANYDTRTGRKEEREGGRKRERKELGNSQHHLCCLNFYADKVNILWGKILH